MKNINKLKKNEIFVFGSNVSGNHTGGAARQALEKFGAIQGQGEGLQGKSYAIPTMEGIDLIKSSVITFIEFAKNNPKNIFILTEIGCGIAGYKASEIAPLFKNIPKNIRLPGSFLEIIGEKRIKAYKVFNKDFKCRDFQFEVGKTYEHQGRVKICGSGFHACINPFDCLNYYNLTESRFAEVEIWGDIDFENGDSKKCARFIHIVKELSEKEYNNVCLDYLISECKKECKVITVKDTADDNSGDSAKIGSFGDSAKIGSSGDSAKIGSSGDYAKIGSSGDSAKIGSSGDSAKIGSFGDYAKIGSFGDSAKIGSFGDYAQIGSFGYYAQIGSFGDSAKIGSFGDYAQIGSFGDSAQIGSSGDSAKIGSSGYSAKIGSSGDSAQIGSYGDYAKIGSSGYSAQIGSSGDYAQIGSSGDSAKIGSFGYSAKIGSSGDSAQIGSYGDSAKIESEGKDAVIACIGPNSIIKAKEGTWITLAEYDDDGKCLCVKSAKIDGTAIKADVFYRLINEKFERVYILKK